jgi:predicted MFS family arabinose efflux permease
MKGSSYRFNYGWVIVGVTMASMVLVYGVRHSFLVFYSSILSDSGWQRGDTAAILSVNILVYGLAAPVAGHIADLWKPKNLMILGILLLALATAGCALANWFSSRRGLVLGLGQMGSGLSFVYGLLVELLITRLGWRLTFLAVAVMLLLLVLPLAAFLFLYRPEDRIATRSSRQEGAAQPVTAGHHWTPVQAMKTVRLWLFVLSESVFWGVGGYLVLAHQVKFATDAGYSSLLAASIFALFGVAMLTGQFASLISDWIGREVTATLATVLVVIAIAALLLTTAAKAVWLLYAHAILFGLGVGGIVGPWLGGYLYDRMGSYTLPFLISGVCFLAACAGFWVAAPRRGVAPPRR